MGCKGKKKKDKTKEPSKTTASKQSAVKQSTETAAPAGPQIISLRGDPRKREPRKKAKRNYFGDDDRYRTTVAAGLTTIAGGGGKVPPKEDDKHEKKVMQWLENWYITETHLLQYTHVPSTSTNSPKGKKLGPSIENMKKGMAAQKRLIEMEKKFGETTLTALKKGQMKTKENKRSFETLPANKEATFSLDDPSYEMQWW